MKKKRYAIYEPPKPGLPYLAVVLSGRSPSGMFGCADREAAEDILAQIRSRTEAREQAQAALAVNLTGATSN